MLVFDSFLGTHYIDKKEEDAALSVLRAKSLFRYDGPNLQYKTLEFEDEISKFLNCKYIVACSSGAAALKLCCISLDIGVGDEVIMPSFTFIASAASVLSCGAVPSFVDVDESMNIDPHKIIAAITPRTKAIMVVHIQGVPCDMEPIIEIANKHNLAIIEDGAQAFGSRYKGNRVGSIGNVAAFSLQANKVITSGEGGIFCTNDENLYLRARNYHDNGAIRTGNDYPTWDLVSCSFGENFKITELQSAIALEQLKKFEMIVSKQKESYYQLVNGIHSQYFKLRKITPQTEFIPVSLCFLFDNEKIREDFLNYTNEHKVATECYCDRVLTKINVFKSKSSWHSSGFPFSLANYKSNNCIYTENLVDLSVWLPISPLLEEEDIDYICKVINDFRV